MLGSARVVAGSLGSRALWALQLASLRPAVCSTQHPLLTQHPGVTSQEAHTA